MTDDEIPGLIVRAQALLDVNRPAEAGDLLRSVLATSPDHPAALRLLANTQYRLGDYRATLDTARAAQAAEPEHEHAYRIAALALARLRRGRQAREQAERAISLAPNNWQTHLGLVEADRFSRRVTERTEKAAYEAVRLAPHEAAAHAALGSVLISRHKPRAAETAINEALRIDPTNATALNERGRLYLRRGRLGTAAAGFIDGAAVDPRQTAMTSNLLIAVYKTVQIASFAMAAAYLVVWHAAGGNDIDTAPRTILIVWLVAVTGLAAILRILRRQVGSRLRIVARVVRNQSKALVAYAIVVLAALAALGIAGLTPDPARRWVLGFGSGLVVLTAILRLNVLRALRRRARRVASRSV